MKDSKVELSQLMMPEHANPAGNIHGGTIMKYIDNAALIAAMRHTHLNCVTASVDKIDFLSPVFIGNVLIAKASINKVWNKSMEIGVKVEAECLKTGNKAHVASAYLTFVALNEEDKTVSIPPVEPESKEENKWYVEAQKRKDLRIKYYSKHKHQNKMCLIRKKNL